MTRRGREALLWARGQHRDGGREWGGICLVFVRSCYEVPALFPSAASAWHGASFRHRETDGNKVPRGVPFFWTGGSQGFGHVVISAGGGMCWSNDINTSGAISFAPINEITNRWRQTPQGWTEDINKVRIWEPPEPPVIDVSDLVRAFGKDPGRVGDAGTRGSRRDVRQFELTLSRKGYLDAHYIDGSYGTKTVEGMRRFQRDHGLEGNGEPTMESVKAVGRGRFKVRA